MNEVILGSLPVVLGVTAYTVVGFYLTSDRGYRPDRSWFPLSFTAMVAGIALGVVIAILTTL